MSDKIFNEEEKEAVMGDFLSGKDFDGEGLRLCIEGKQAVPSDNPRFGAKEDGRGLKKGETWLYTFKTKLGKEKIFQNGSARLAAAIARTNPSKGDLLHIRREGEGTATLWFVEKADEIQYG